MFVCVDGAKAIFNLIVKIAQNYSLQKSNYLVINVLLNKQYK